MLGKETKTLSKVIGTVVKFTDEQVKHISEYEEYRTTVSYN